MIKPDRPLLPGSSTNGRRERQPWRNTNNGAILKKIFVVFAFLGLSHLAFSQIPIAFNALNGLGGAMVVKPYFDRGFAVLGYDTTIKSRYVLFKLDLQGNVIMSKRFASNNPNEEITIIDLVVNPDSSISLAGEVNYKNSSGHSIDYDLMTIKVDKYDSMVLCKTIRDTSINIHNQRCNKIVSIRDGGWLVLGGSLPDAPYFNPASTIIKVDSLGNRAWSYQYEVSGSYDVQSHDAIEMSDGSISILATFTYPPYRYWGILKLSSTGNVSYARDFRIQSYHGKIISLIDSNLICFVQGVLYSVNVNGTINWNKNYSGVINDVIQMPDRRFFMAGTKSIPTDFSFGNPNYFLSCLDSAANTIWAKNYGRCQNDYGSYISVNNNQVFIWGVIQREENGSYLGSYLCTDTNGTAPCKYNDDTLTYIIDSHPTANNVSVNKTSWLHTQNYSVQFEPYQLQLEDVCTMPDTCAEGFWGIGKLASSNAVSVYPNPFSNKATFQISNNIATTLSLYDILGRQILRKTFTNSITLTTDQLPDGIYLYELHNDNELNTNGKIIKQ